MVGIKEWTKTFKAFANEHRLRILRLLMLNKELSVKEVSSRIHLGGKATSKHLIILSTIGFLESYGKKGGVWYRLHPHLPREVRYMIKHFLCTNNDEADKPDAQ